MILTRLQSLRSSLFGNPDTSGPVPQNGALILCSVIATYLLFLLLMQPDLLLRGEMWAEMATNYFANARADNLWQQLFATDAGYIPLPQRIIALIANWLLLPAATIPYFYAWTAALGTALLAGTFSLPVFRPLVRNDALRVLTSLLLLAVVDFETRTFINFTYFVPCFCAFLTALSLTTTRDIPRWGWLMVPLMLSKPASLVVLPAMLVTSLVSATRFRRIAIACALVGVAQLARVVISQHEGAMPLQAANITLAAKLLATIKYFFGFLSGFSVGPTPYANYLVGKFNTWFFIGVVLSLLLAIVVRKLRSPANALILVGTSLLFFTVLLDCFALSTLWNTGMDRLIGIPVYRHIIVGYFGVVLTVVGLFETVSQYIASRWGTKANPHLLGCIPFALFIFWSLAGGWWHYGFSLGSNPTFPAQDNSAWQLFSKQIDSNAPICVPINPLGWVYANQCAAIGPLMSWDQQYGFMPLAGESDKHIVEIAVPRDVASAHLMSIAIAVRPHVAKSTLLIAKGYAQMRDGHRAKLIGSTIAAYSGSLLILNFGPDINVVNAELIHLEFDEEIDIAFAQTKPDTPAVMWLGTALH